MECFVTSMEEFVKIGPIHYQQLQKYTEDDETLQKVVRNLRQELAIQSQG